MDDPTLPSARKTAPSLLRLVLWLPVWTAGFGLFFGTLFGASLAAYRLAFLESAVFTVVIQLSLWVVSVTIAPALQRARGDAAWPEVTAAYVVMAILGTYAASMFVHRFVQRGFLDGPRAWVDVGLWALLFSALFSGMSLARHFHEETVRRAAQVERVRAELVRAELRALQAQVNPHFLFNTLNSIAALIAVNPAAAEDLTTRLADVFRYALTATRRETAPLEDELEFVRTWLSIEHVRFGDRLRVEEAIGPDLGSVRVPALLLQPLVENAVRYAVGHGPEGGTVRIVAERRDASLRLTVADDGPGFDPTAPPRGTGTGLEGVRERLRLAGDGHRMDLDTAPGHGTRVTLTLPLEPRPPRPLPDVPERCS